MQERWVTVVGSPLVENFQFSTNLNNHPSTPSQTRLLQPIHHTSTHTQRVQSSKSISSATVVTTGVSEIYSILLYSTLLHNSKTSYAIMYSQTIHPSHHKLPHSPHNHRTTIAPTYLTYPPIAKPALPPPSIPGKG